MTDVEVVSKAQLAFGTDWVALDKGVDDCTLYHRGKEVARGGIVVTDIPRAKGEWCAVASNIDGKYIATLRSPGGSFDEEGEIEL